ncbi:MAG TPA: hypothetical protein V6C99_02645 [Oculatellaceae cyanobacterium]
MRTARQIALLATLGMILSPVFALAEPQLGGETTQYYLAQSLPPLQPPDQPYNYGTPQYGQPPLQGYVVTAPPGTVVSATVNSAISSEYARVGDRFTATLGAPIVGGNSVILPAGSQVEGQVVMARPAGRAGKNGELEVRFTSARLPNGQTVPLSARIKTDDGTGVIKGGTTAGRVGKAALTTGVGAGLGAALGTAMGPLSGGKVGRGAIYGTTLGAGVGALGAAMQKGTPAVLDSSQPIDIVLDQPLTTAPVDNGGYQQQPNYYQQPNQQSYY